MTDLTEKWKKGELPEGHYYVKDGENMIAEYIDGYFYNNGNPMTSFSGGVDEVLAEVPDYVEWRNMVNCACEEHEANKRLIEENEQLKERVSKLKKMQYSYTPEEWNMMLRTVNRTKELLKRCQTLLYDNGFLFNPQDREKAKDVIADICEVLDD